MKSQKAKKKNPNRNPAFFNNVTMKQFNNVLLFLFILLLPTQLGKHFFFDFSYLSGIRVDYLAPTIYLTDILAFILISLNLKSVFKSFANKRIFFLLLIFLINFLAAENKYITLYRYIKIFELTAIFIIFKQLSLSKSKNIPVYSFLIGSVFELFLSLMQFINKRSLQGLFYLFGERPLSLSMPGIAKASINSVEILRPYGTFSHPNSLGGFYLVVYFFVLTNHHKISPVIKNLLLLLSSLLILLSFSKIAIIIYLFLNLVYFWKSSLKKDCQICFYSRLIILFIISLLFLQAKTDPLTIQKRLLLMKNSLLVIVKNIFFGVGLGNYLIVQQQFPQRFVDVLNQPVHNIFLLLISEMGVVLTGLLVIFFFREIANAFRNFPYIFAAILLTGLFDHYWLTLQQNFLLIGLIFGIL
ncbi:hypothetical protein HY612_05205 [Candidatus Roizmanbacteria bacterium]|nr:hypothetical protein [Candidatus Roizmanbacteria bacterium]